jgi:uncharacterized protein
MAFLTIAGDELVLELTAKEKLAGLHGDIRVPLSAVRDVRVEHDGLGAVQGLRAPGLALPGRVKIGTWWRRRGRRTFVVVRRGMPAIRVRLAGTKPDELLVSTSSADTLAEALRARAGSVSG